LKGQRFESLEQAQAYLDHWEERWADTRINKRGQGRQVIRFRVQVFSDQVVVRETFVKASGVQLFQRGPETANTERDVGFDDIVRLNAAGTLLLRICYSETQFFRRENDSTVLL
jgi:hypothetical protein